MLLRRIRASEPSRSMRSYRRRDVIESPSEVPGSASGIMARTSSRATVALPSGKWMSGLSSNSSSRPCWPPPMWARGPTGESGSRFIPWKPG